MGFLVRDTVRPMFTRKFMQTALIWGLTVSAASFTVACGPSTPPAKTADHIKSGTMPDGGEWEGVYYDQRLGFLHLTVSNGAAQGAWRTTVGDKWGELYGEINGDLLKFSWTERKIGVVGPAAESKGKGYFKYTIPREGEAHELKGEWGLGDDEVGHPWDCVKQTNMEPDPKSVRPNEMESRVGAAGFDGAKGDADIQPTVDDGKEPEENQEEVGEGAGDEDPL